MPEDCIILCENVCRKTNGKAKKAVKAAKIVALNTRTNIFAQARMAVAA